MGQELTADTCQGRKCRRYLFSLSEPQFPDLYDPRTQNLREDSRRESHK